MYMSSVVQFICLKSFGVEIVESLHEMMIHESLGGNEQIQVDS